VKLVGLAAFQNTFALQTGEREYVSKIDLLIII